MSGPKIVVLGATGNFPQGKLRDDDQGELASRIAHTDKAVIIEFGKPVTWVGLPPKDARLLAAKLLEHADGVEKLQVKPKKHEHFSRAGEQWQECDQVGCDYVLQAGRWVKP